MNKFLVAEDNPDGYKLEDAFYMIRSEILSRCQRITDDERAEARHVLNNNIEILSLLSDAIALAEDSTHILDKSFGPSQSGSGGEPRIGS